MSVVVGIALAFVGARLASALNTPDLEAYLWLVGPTVLVAGLYQSLTTWAVREGGFGVIAVSRAVQAVALVTVQLVGGVWHGGLFTLLAAVTVGWAMGAAVLALPLRHPDPSGRVRAGDLAQVARRYAHFPRFATWSSLLNRGALEMPPLALSAIYGPEVAGLFLLAYRALVVPANTIVQSVYQVYVHRGSQLVRFDPDGLRNLYRRTTRRLFTWTLPAVIVLIAAGPMLFALFFGEAWREAGVYAQLMAPALLAFVPTAAIAASFTLVERPDLELRRECWRVLLIGCAFVLADSLGWSPRGAIAAYTVAFVTGAIALLTMTWREVRLVNRPAVAV